MILRTPFTESDGKRKCLRNGDVSTMAKWKYGISFAEKSPMTAPLPLAGDLYENMRMAAALGYDAVEMHTREIAEFDLARIREMSARGEGHICMLVTGRLYTEGKLSLLDASEDSVDACIQGMKRYIDLAAALQSGIVLGWVKGNVPPGGDRERYLELLGGRLKALNDYSREKGVPIVVEVINHYETNLFNRAEETLTFLDQNRLDNCYVHLDTYHMNIEELDPCQAIRMCGKKLGYFHVADNSRRYPGSGQLDFKKILGTLDEIGYQGYVSVECIPEPDRVTAAKRAIAHLHAVEP